MCLPDWPTDLLAVGCEICIWLIVCQFYWKYCVNRRTPARVITHFANMQISGTSCHAQWLPMLAISRFYCVPTIKANSPIIFLHAIDFFFSEVPPFEQVWRPWLWPDWFEICNMHYQDNETCNVQISGTCTNLRIYGDFSKSAAHLEKISTDQKNQIPKNWQSTKKKNKPKPISTPPPKKNPFHPIKYLSNNASLCILIIIISPEKNPVPV